MKEKINNFSQNNQGNVKQNTFIFLIIITSFLLCVFLLCIWLIPTIGFASIHKWLSHLVAFVVISSISFILWGMVALIVHMYTGRALVGAAYFRAFMLKMLFPFIEMLACFFNISLKNVRRSFIEVNNRLIDVKKKYRPRDILVLLPHCLQASKCKLRLTYNSDNCVRCGKCSIGELLQLRDRWGIQLATATGGTMARNIIKQMHPKLIIGVACERDLVSGIQDIRAVPVIGVLNDCSKGVCMDTSVDVSSIESVLEQIVDVSIEETFQQDRDVFIGNVPFQGFIPKYKDIL